MYRSLTSTVGKPAPNWVQLAPPLVVRYTPSQVAAYTVLPLRSSGAASSFWIGTFGKPLLAAAQLAPPLVDLTTHTAWPLGFSDATYSTVLLAHAMLLLNPAKPVTLLSRRAQVAPPSAVTRMLPPVETAATWFRSSGLTETLCEVPRT